MAAADIRDRQSFEAWLQGKPRELCVLMAARAALRVLPLFSGFAVEAKEPRQFADLTGSLFRATALARIAAVYPTRANEFDAAAADAAASATAATAARAAASARSAAADAADAAADAAASAAATTAARAAVSARSAAAATAAAYAAAATAAATSTANAAAFATSTANAAAAAWAAVRDDAAIFERDGLTGLISTPLWPTEQPPWSVEAWSTMRAALPRRENWEVWTVWYKDRLAGANYDEAREVVFAAVPPEVWDEGAKEANAWIKAELGKLRLARFANRAGPIEPEINAAGKLDIARRSATLAYPNNRSERDRLALQAFCQTQATRLLEALRQQKFGNFRDADFADLLAYYLVDLPTQGHEGTFLLADAQAAELRDLAEDLAPILPSRFARGLREILAKHDELRGYYVEIVDVDRAIHQSQPLSAPPPAPLLRLQQALQDNSPEEVTAELVEQTKQVLRAAPTIELDGYDRGRASAPDIVHQSPRPPGVPSARQRHAYNVATLLGKLNKLAGVSNVKDGVAIVGGAHNVGKFLTEDLPALIAEVLKHWQF